MIAGKTTVLTAAEGAVIETIHYGIPSGNIYKLGDRYPFKNGSRRWAYTKFTHRKVSLAENKCLLLTSEEWE